MISILNTRPINGVGILPYSNIREKVNAHFMQMGYQFDKVIANSAIVSDYVELGPGTQVLPRAIIQTGVTVGENSIINTGSIIEHDCKIGNNNHIAPGATLCGGVTTSDTVYIGANATIIQGITITKNSIVGAGAVITKEKDNYNLDVVQIDDSLMTEKLLTGSYKDEIKLSKIRRNLLFKFLFNINCDINLTKYRYLLTKEYEVFNLNYNCEYVDIFEEINDLSERDYLLICELFGYESFIFNNKCIMFLQPFFEDGLVSSLDYEISIYKHILKCEKISEKDIIIKPHPRSNIDYSFYFPEAGWIPKDFPYELLLRLKNERFDKVISVYSSGVKEFSLISNEVVNFGTKDFPELPYMSMIRKKAKDND
ncbi:polysialyltransferase family glycosyltransferase [Providencia sp. wls1922]|uniref:polysialyltransferase family glycosyltransferase n=1 Tax=Providencia sp. wls1922 TaxID=2675152 RepID=UPI001E5557C8|nr:polysialyltransferase family glycosyltransferase [Providencia sp. wls1922]